MLQIANYIKATSPTFVTISCCMLCLLSIDKLVRDGGIIALVTLFVSFFGDMYDGHIARNTQSCSDFGNMADKIADRIRDLALLYLLVKTGKINMYHVLAYVLRDVIVYSCRALGIISNSSSLFAKVKTFLFPGVILYMYVAKYPSIYVFYLAILVNWMSGMEYFRDNMSKSLKDLHTKLSEFSNQFK